MPFSLDTIADDIFDYLREDIYTIQPVYDQAIPDIQTIQRDETGRIPNYVTVQIGDIQPWGSTSFIGAQGDDYVLPIRWQVVSPDPGIARKIAHRGVHLFLGASFAWAGQIRKRNSGDMYPLKNSDGSVECYVFPVSFGLVVQLADIPETP